MLGSSDAEAIQQHMLKLFDNCKELKLGRGNMVTGMRSDEGEHYDLKEPIKAEVLVKFKNYTIPFNNKNIYKNKTIEKLYKN